MTHVTKRKDLLKKRVFLAYFVVESFTDPLPNQLVPPKTFGPNVLYPNCFHGFIRSHNKFFIASSNPPFSHLKLSSYFASQNVVYKENKD